MDTTGWTRAAGWKVVGVGAAVVGLGALGLAGLTGGDGDGPERITLTERAAVQEVAPPPAVTGQPADLSPDGESLDSPLQSADDSPDGMDSVESPDEMDIFGVNIFESANSSDSPDAPAPAPASVSVDDASFDSPDYQSVSVDSPS